VETLVQSFLSNVVALCIRRLNRFPRTVLKSFEQWAKKLDEAFNSSRLASAVATALEELHESHSPLAGALEAELRAVVDLQNCALEQPQDQDATGTYEPIETSSARAKAKDLSRALSASKSLLGSLREILKDLPFWAKGLLKVGEELIEIYGPAR
jgi:exonuclease VII large subunit